MNLRPRLRAGAFLAFAAAAAAGLLAAPAAAAADGSDEAAVAYLEARAAAIVSGQPATVLAPHIVPGSALAAREAFVARGAALRHADLGHIVDDIDCRVTVTASSLAPDGLTATVVAHAVTTVTWHARRATSVEASGVDHRLTLTSDGGVWRVAADASGDVELPAQLERAGVPAPTVRDAARRLEASAARAPQPVSGMEAGALDPEAAAIAPASKAFIDRIEYDRDAAKAYADKYALDYNATYARFSGDCCNFVSQGARAGGMPMALGNWTSGWWYDKEGTSSPSDDNYSWSWISCSRQIAFWLGTRIDWVSSVTYVSRGDVVYYDWTGDGSWDHVAIFAGVDSLGHKVIDAHTTDHYQYYWKLGTKYTKYKFGRVRAAWVI